MTVQYLIDSENVGDFWIPLLDLPAEKSALIVFYTRNSPHMSYESLIRLKESDRTVTFVKCYEGTNALDFQLVSELGYLIGKEEDGSFVIVTNDTGFDAAVKYWRRKKKSVKRITGKECKNLERRLKEDIGENRSSRQRAASMGNPPAEPDASDPSIEKGDGELSGAGRQPAEETEQRSSRPVLRDAESAALPDSDEDSYEEISYGETSYGETSFEETSFEETSFEETADDLEEEDSVFDGPSYGDDDQEDNDQGMFDDAVFGSGVADDEPDRVDESRQPEEDEEEKNGEEERTLRGDGSEAEPETDPADEDMTERPEDFPEDHSFAQEEEEGSSEEFLSPDHQGHERIVPGVTIPESESYFSTASAEGSLTGEEVVQPLEETPGLPFSATKDSDKQKTSDQDRTEETASSETASSEKNSSEGNSSEGNFSRGSTSERNPSGTEFSETEASGAENGEKDDQGLSPESGHRSKSRRSRTRRSRSASRKTEQPAEEDQVRDDDEKQRTIPSDQEGTSGGQSQPVKAKADSLPDDEEIARIVACIGPENLAELHNQLATFYGDQGKDIYLSIKSNSRNLPVLKPDLGQKFAYYCEIIFARSDYSGEYPADISEFLLNAREKLGNLNSLRYALIKQYGKEKGRRFYFLLKPFVKTMYQM